MKTAIYTVLTNGYDVLKPIIYPTGIDCLVFTDNPSLKVDGWKTIQIDKSEGCKLQRDIKIRPHFYLPEYDTTIYIDANFEVKRDILPLLKKFRGGMMTVKHPNRNCVYQEGLAIKAAKKDDPETVDSQIIEYYKSGFPSCFGLWATGFIIRDRSVSEMCDDWAKEMQKHSHRDQLSLPISVKNNDVKISEITHGELMRYFKINKHKGNEPIQVWYSSPFRSDKNIGKANNDFIELLPENAWICITDGDSMFLEPDYGTFIEQIIKENGDNFQLIGSVCNRLGGLHQCHNNKFSEDLDAGNHYEIAKSIRTEHGTNVEKTTGVAGLVMIFNKSTWKKVGGFKENTITADTEFNKAITRLGGKVGLAKGLYIFHAYRIWEKEHGKAWKSVEHLR